MFKFVSYMQTVCTDIFKKAHSHYSDSVNLDTSQGNFGILGRTLLWFVFVSDVIHSKWSYLTFICITGESKPYAEDKAMEGSTFFLCL